MSQDVGLFYYGGSGGNFCAHLLLLTGNYNCIFNSDIQDFNVIFQNQWNINQVSNWKTSETMIENDRTLHSNLSNKLYLKCNPATARSLSLYTGKTVVIYTDIETQIYLAKTKNAFWFYKNSPLDKWLAIRYANIKTLDWPACSSLVDFNNLPDHIKEECLTKWNFDDFVDSTKFIKVFRESQQILYKGDYVLADLKNVIDIDQADIQVKLQDLIKTKGEILFEQLGIQGNKQTSEFVDMYVQLHTPEQQSYLLNS